MVCDYTPKGTVSKIGDMDTYFIGQYDLMLCRSHSLTFPDVKLPAFSLLVDR